MPSVALFGIGRAGLIHAKNLLRGGDVKLKYVIDTNPEFAAKQLASVVRPADEMPTVCSLDDASVALGDADVVACVICTPTPDHEACVLMSLKAKKAVFCEKPVALSIPRTKECYAKAREMGVPLYCAFQRRFDVSFRSMHDRIRAGEIGKLHFVRSTSRDCPTPSTQYLSTSGGFFHDSGVHDLDVVCWLLQENPTEIYANAHAFNPEIAAINDVDTIAITMKFPSGALASIDLSRHAKCYGYDQRVEAFGENGMLQLHNSSPTSVSKHAEAGETKESIHFSFPTKFAGAYQAEMVHFLAVLRGEVDSLYVGEDDCVRASVLASLAHESFVKKMPVAVNM